MSDTDKRAEYVRRAEEARDAAKASANDQLKMVLYQIARLWERLGRGMKVCITAAAPTAGACSLWMTDCCIRMHFHCPCCWFHI